MLAVSFFFVLAGGILFSAGIVGVFLQLLFSGSINLGSKPVRKWLGVSAAGFLALVLGLLMAMT